MSDDDVEREYESGPFCRHCADPSDCETLCGTCGHECFMHDHYDDKGACNHRSLDDFEFDCNCAGWTEIEA